MCRVEETSGKCDYRKQWEMKIKMFGEGKVEKLKNSMVSRSRMKLWMIRALTTILIWTCFAHLMTLGEIFGPKLLKGWPSCFTQSTSELPLVDPELSSTPPKLILPPKSKFSKVPFFLFTISWLILSNFHFFNIWCLFVCLFVFLSCEQAIFSVKDAFWSP